MRLLVSSAVRAVLSFSFGLALIWAERGAMAQGTMGTPQVYRTTENQPLISDSIPVFIPSTTGNPWLSFHFGFETDETIGPGTIFDAFTLSLVDEQLALTAVLLTADVSGVVYGPSTPGAVPLLPEDFTASLIPIPDLQPNLSQQMASSLTVMLPPEFAGANTTLYLDLFDNQNGIASLGWFSNLTVVPEPSVPLLIGAGLLGLATFRYLRP